jgi:serine protease Do
MRALKAGLRAMLFAVIGATFLAGVSYLPGDVGIAAPKAGATVKIALQLGHGSGVHIGGGNILTAQHVVTDNTAVGVVTDQGATIPAAVVWTSPAYDVALVRIADPAAIGTSRLSCREPKIGDHVRAVGNSGPLAFAEVHGRVAAGLAERGRWKATVIMNIATLPGHSGGPVFDALNQIVGLVVAGYTQAPLDIVVPGSAICGLLGR